MHYTKEIVALVFIKMIEICRISDPFVFCILFIFSFPSSVLFLAKKIPFIEYFFS